MTLQDTLYYVRHRLMDARIIAEDFRGNTSLDTIIREYEARVKELIKQINQ